MIYFIFIKMFKKDVSAIVKSDRSKHEAKVAGSMLGV